MPLRVFTITISWASSWTDISKIFTKIFLYLFLPLKAFGNHIGSRNQSSHWCHKSLRELLAVKYDCYSHFNESTINTRISPWGLSSVSLFLSQAVIGILGNFSLLRHYLSLYHSRCRMRDTDLILMHLTLANFFLILSKAVPNTMIALGWKHFISDLGCQVIFYVYRMTKGVSIGTTCLLSVYQTITISPMNSCWKELKVKAQKYVGCSLSLCWILHISVNLIFPAYVSYVSGQWSNRDTVKQADFQFCSNVDHHRILGLVYGTLIVFPEILFSVLIIWSSGSMVFILFRHKHRVQRIHRTKLSPRPSAESRATQSILLLLSTFVCFHTLSSMFSICLAFYQDLNIWLVNASELISLGFPTVSPFLFMNHESTLCRILSAHIRIRKSPILRRNM
ncbi:vomeronasal type-1 receptor 4-like [Erinaceus europaeus]|uniref:Vomeronasal type-1 receptor n=1 Tax=Erinaceus europaeus TaxID=9365 RepID=A0A1S3WWM3_ERIEU|nr:vomeronasal type-1 receptor 4-like [Erinaceus europaeus]